ncbi:polynucleotide kinase [Gordonia phage Nithya]|nr:polynucleotide kinase [Gordonia phage Nithya]
MPTALIDFDGVIHKYSKGWSDGTAYDGPMPFAKEGLKEIEELGYEVVIFSTRDANQIKEWLKKHEFPEYEVTNVKKPATFILDDRAIRFKSWWQSLAMIEMNYGSAKKGN